MYIDSHCHLNHDRLKNAGGADEIIKNAEHAGVEGMLTICCRMSEETDELRDIAQRHKNVWYTVGTHPHDAGNPEEQAFSADDISAMATADPKIVGIGESGLDYYYKNSEPDDQKASFRKHIQACIQSGLPLIVHARDADEDIMRIIREEGSGTSLKGVMHCFSSGRKMGEEALEFGFYISFSGIVTFNSAKEIQAFARDVPLDRILVETDAPYLAPEPHRGRLNEPALVTHTGQFVADLKDISEDDLADHTKNNFFRLFHKAGKAAA